MSLLNQLTGAQKSVVVLAGLTLALAVGNLGRGIVALQYAFNLPDLSTTVPLSYFAAMGGFWSAAFFTCTVGLSCFREWGRRLALTAVTLYQTNVWINHVLFDVSNYARQVVPRNLLFTILLLFIFWGSLHVPSIREVFDRREEEE